ncbi:hypothetical protein [Mariniradius sediminis]|uniref:Capsular polysaccharide synthesis protein n=1 Tax=Mariniradius sediminis TaxID=2909237 RepID=A0ABS9BQH3_9BACT|nr:hypothetical protein [Mariniradius sediminis]MCF1750311.1 hypothetical protein [Mariniradius sediminis]
MKRLAEDLSSYSQYLSGADGKLIVLSTYFSSKQDPVRGGFQQTDNFAYIQHWYNSVQKHDLHAVVFYDRLSEDFIQEYQTEKIRFIRCQLGKMSLNDERFFIYQEFIPWLPDGSFVLTTDINDVVINRNPLQLIHAKPEKLFVGRGNRKVWKNGIWTLTALRQFHDRFNKAIPVSFLDYPVFNPGTIAGRKDLVLALFHQMTRVFEVLADARNYDMPVFNYVLKENYYPASGFWDRRVPFSLAWNYCYYGYRLRRKLEFSYRKEKYDLVSHQDSVVENEKIYAGFPFVSMFSWYENPSEAYLIHK